MENIYNDPVIAAFWKKIVRWMDVLRDDPSWQEFNRQKFAYTLAYDEFSPEERGGAQEFVFGEKMAKEHAFILCYIELIGCFNALTQCEYYFRRYPFKGLPVSHADYLTRNCEVFFNKLYEFRERLKNLGAALKEVSPAKYMDTGKLIRQYDNTFREELKERNLLNHHTRFSDVVLTKFAIIALLEEDQIPRPFADSARVEYRRVCAQWIKRIRSKRAAVKLYLVNITEFLDETCGFLPV
jgi:hypothetical protein